MRLSFVTLASWRPLLQLLAPVLGYGSKKRIDRSVLRASCLNFGEDRTWPCKYVGCGSRSDELRWTVGRDRALILSKYGKGSHVIQKIYRRESL